MATEIQRDPRMTQENGHFPNVFASVRALSRSDKLLLIQLLAGDLANDEGASLVGAGDSYPVWNPHNAFDAAAVMLHELYAKGTIA